MTDADNIDAKSILEDVLQGNAQPEEIDRDAVLDDLREVAEELGKSPTTREYNNHNSVYTVKYIQRLFGSWNAAKEEAGLEINKRGAGTTVDINESYFESIDSAEKAYWLGTVIGTSTMSRNESGGLVLQVNRSMDEAYFVYGFTDAINSGHAIATFPQEDMQDRISVAITNSTFNEHLADAGYTEDHDDGGLFPSIPVEFRTAFIRGYLESSGYFSTGGWRINTENPDRAQQLQSWLEELGVKRPTVGSHDGVERVVNVANTFDIKTMFEACWPNQVETDPSFTPYVQDILAYLSEEYPYTEDVEYLS